MRSNYLLLQTWKRTDIISRFTGLVWAWGKTLKPPSIASFLNGSKWPSIMTRDDLSERLKLQLWAVKSVEQLNIFGTWEPLSWASFRVMGQNCENWVLPKKRMNTTNQYVIELLEILRSLTCDSFLEHPRTKDLNSEQRLVPQIRSALCARCSITAKLWMSLWSLAVLELG